MSKYGQRRGVQSLRVEGGTFAFVEVGEAATGRRYRVRLRPGEDRTEAIRQELSRLSGVPPKNQILLHGGPPYKALRQQLPPGLVCSDSQGSPPESQSSSSSQGEGSTSPIHVCNVNKGSPKDLKVFMFDWAKLAPPPNQHQQHQQQRQQQWQSTASGVLGFPDEGDSANVNANASVSPADAQTEEDKGEMERRADIDREVSDFAGPAEVTLPKEAEAVPSPLPSAEGSVLLHTIANYERGSMLALNRGQAYAKSSARRLKGGVTCVERMEVQTNALEAAVSNLLDHWDPLRASYGALSERLDEQAARHQGMLETFEDDLEKLRTIQLHPALVSKNVSLSSMTSEGDTSSNPAGDASGTGGSREERTRTSSKTLSETGSDAGGETMASGSAGEQPEGSSSQQSRGNRWTTLYDCVPVEREMKLLSSCKTSQLRFREASEAVGDTYATIKKGLDAQRHNRVVHVEDDENIKASLERARELCSEQDRRCRELQANYSEAFGRAAKDDWTGDQEKQDAIQYMTELTVIQEKIVPLMKEADQEIMNIVAEIARAKAELSLMLSRRLREVSTLQTDIGRIQKRQEVVSTAWGQKEEQFTHLGKVAKMPLAYQSFLKEVVKCLRYHESFEKRVSDFCRSMAAHRSAEVVAREAFLQEHMNNLPPSFQKMAPGLVNPLPSFEIRLLRSLYPGDLPDIREEDVGDEEAKDSSPSAPPSSLKDDDAEVDTGLNDEGSVMDTDTSLRGDADRTEAGAEDEGASRGSTHQDPDGHDEGAKPEGTQHASHSLDDVSTQGEGEHNDEGVQTRASDDGGRERHQPNSANLDERRESPIPCESLELENVRLSEELTALRHRVAELERDHPKVADASPPVGKIDKRPLQAEEGKGDGEARESPIRRTDSRSNRSTRETSTADEPSDTPATIAPEHEVDRKRSKSAAAVTSSLGAVLTSDRSVGRASKGVSKGQAVLAPTSRRSSSSGATQSQLAAYRAGLSMLVKLADQLAAATSAATAAATTGTTPRDWDTRPASTITSTVTLKRNSAAATSAASAAAEEAPVDEGTAKDGSFATLTVSTGRALGVTAAAQEGAHLSASASRTLTSAADESVEFERGDGGPVPRQGEDPRTDGTADAKVEGDRPADEHVIAEAAPDDTDGSTQATFALLPESVGKEAAKTVATVSASGDETGGMTEINDTSVSGTDGATGTSDTSGGGRTKSQEPGRDKASAAPPCSAEKGEASLPDRLDATSREVSKLTGPKADGGEDRAALSAIQDAERIRGVAEHVALQLRRMHGRVEELLPYEALASVPRISMCSFNVEDIALFLPTMVGTPEKEGGTVYLAFHVNCPNRYLSEESVNTAREQMGKYPAYILGKIILVEQHVASETPNPYKVADKTVYYVLTAENIC